MLHVEFKTLEHFEGLDLPAYETALAAGADLRAAVAEAEPMTLEPGERALIPTGFCMALPHGYEAQIRPRSGLAYKHGVTCLNTPGTIDADYRGEVKVLLITITQPIFKVVTELSETIRGSGGFGSTGVK